MRKLFYVFLLVVLGTIGASAQYLVHPIKKVIPGYYYTFEELKQFINSEDPIVEPWCKIFLGLVQDGLTKTNEDLFIVNANDGLRKTVIDIIDKYCIVTKRDLNSGFKNSGKTLQNTIKFVVDNRDFKDMEVLTFKFGSCEKDVVKMNCFNEPDLPERKVYVQSPPKNKEPENVVEHRWQDYKKSEAEKSSNEEIIIVDKKPGRFYVWQKRNGWWAYPLTGLVVTGATGFVAHDSNHQWYLWFPKSSPHGTMSGGRPYTTTPSSTPITPGDGSGGRGN